MVPRRRAVNGQRRGRAHEWGHAQGAPWVAARHGKVARIVPTAMLLAVVPSSIDDGAIGA